MKKRAFALLFGGALALSLCACGEADTGGATSEEPQSPPDLAGVWTQVDASDGDSYQQATISGDEITINWVAPDSTSLYWAGTYVSPTTADEPYTWTSENDTAKTGSALLASMDETKDFTYENGQISYEVSAMGTTTTVRLEKTGDAPAVIKEDTRNYDVTIDSATIEKDQYSGENVIIVNMIFTNNSGETIAPDIALYVQAFQDGVQIDSTFLTDSQTYDSMSASREVQPGTTYEFQQAFALENTESTIEISVSELLSTSGDPIAEKTFDPTALA